MGLGSSGSPADAAGSNPCLIDGQQAPVVGLGNVQHHHGLREAVDGIAQCHRVPCLVCELHLLPAKTAQPHRFSRGEGCPYSS